MSAQTSKRPSADQLLAQFSKTAEKPVTTAEDKGRVTVGNVFLQPTKSKTNYKFCYWGFLAKDGSFAGGFTMANSKVLALVKEGFLPKDCLEAFQVYAKKYAAEGQQVI